MELQRMLGVPPFLAHEERIRSRPAAPATEASPASLLPAEHPLHEQRTFAGRIVCDGSGNDGQVVIAIDVDDLYVLRPHRRPSGPRTACVKRGLQHAVEGFITSDQSLSFCCGLRAFDVVAAVDPEPVFKSTEGTKGRS